MEESIGTAPNTPIINAPPDFQSGSKTSLNYFPKCICGRNRTHPPGFGIPVATLEHSHI